MAGVVSLGAVVSQTATNHRTPTAAVIPPHATVAAPTPSASAQVATPTAQAAASTPPATVASQSGGGIPPALDVPAVLSSVTVAPSVLGHPSWKVVEDTLPLHRCTGHTTVGQPDHPCRAFHVVTDPAWSTGAGTTHAVGGIFLFVGTEPLPMPVIGHRTVTGRPATVYQISGTCGDENLLTMTAGPLTIEIDGNACGPNPDDLVAIAQSINGLPN